MSIHTILSQMENNLIESGVAVRNPKIKSGRVTIKGTRLEVSELFYAFATRIVEEAKREERSRAEKAEKLLDDVCIIYQKHEDDLSIMDEVRDLMRLRISEGKDVSAAWRYLLDSRTKLQKMKEI